MEKENKEKEKSDKLEIKKKENPKKEELTDEDIEYKNNIDRMVEGLFDIDPDLRMNSYNLIKKEVTTSTSSMTSIPKPLKFLRKRFNDIKNYYEKFIEKNDKDKEFKLLLSDLISVLLTVINTDNKEEYKDMTILKYVLSGTKNDITSWGQEYIRSLCSDLSYEYNQRLNKDESINDLMELVNKIVPYLITQHCENEAIDLLIEVDKINEIKDFITEKNFKKICLYLLAITNYSADTDEYRETLELVYSIYFTKFHEYINAMRVAIKIGNDLYIKQTFDQCNDLTTKKQLAFILAREGKFYESENLTNDLREIMSNFKQFEYYRELGKSLEILEPKHPEDVFKSHLEDKKGNGNPIESYKVNMAHSIASSFINAGFGTELLLSKKDSDWIYKNKEEGIICLLAGLGIIHIWDYLDGPGKLYEYSGNREQDIYKRAGRNIGLGISLTSVHDDNDTAVAVLLEELLDKNMTIKISAIYGLCFAAAGTQNEELIQPLLEIFQDFSYGFEVSAFISLCFGLIFIGSANEEVFNELFSILLTRNEGGKSKIFESPFFVLYALGLGLICLGKQKDTDFMIDTLVSIEEFSQEMRDYLKTLLISFSYAGSGNVTKIHELMQIIAKPNDQINPKTQTIAVIGCSLIALGEEVGTEMLSRSFNHFLQFGDIHIKKSVSLAMSLLNLSDPKVTIIDALTKFCYDSDKNVSMCAIFSMGLVSSGSNHSRVAGLLRSLAGFYSSSPDQLFIVRVAQGLLHMGKGIMTLDPLYSHKLLINKVSLAGVLISLFSFTEAEELICKKHQYLIYSLALSMKPKFLITVDENLEPLPLQLMVGQAIDVVGQTGNPRAISGFQTHKSPATINAGERAELSNIDDYITYSDVFENVVIVKEKQKKRQEE